MDRFRGDGPLRIRYRKGLDALDPRSPAIEPLKAAAKKDIPL